MKEINIKVEGMVCGGCEKRVKNALEDIKGVKEVLPDHKKGTVVVKAEEEVLETTLKEKIEDIGFDVVEGN